MSWWGFARATVIVLLVCQLSPCVCLTVCVCVRLKRIVFAVWYVCVCVCIMMMMTVQGCKSLTRAVLAAFLPDALCESMRLVDLSWINDISPQVCVHRSCA